VDTRPNLHAHANPRSPPAHQHALSPAGAENVPMKIELDGTTALVTGSTQGIGFAIARGLAAAGARVIVNGRSAESTAAARARLLDDLSGDPDFAALDHDAREARVVTLAADLATEAGARQAVFQYPDVDVLVNNLGVFGSADPLSIDDDEWRRYFETNVLSAVRLTRAYLPGMMARGWGRVQYIASDSAVVTPVEMIHYGVSKTALLGVSRGFAKAAAGTGVTVNSVIAGPTHTGGVEEFVRELVGHELPWDEAQREFMRKPRRRRLRRRDPPLSAT
jgi:NAD(P)-dependent dehydrogenase (short-subunit alcohol dehydrogenase family)